MRRREPAGQLQPWRPHIRLFSRPSTPQRPHPFLSGTTSRVSPHRHKDRTHNSKRVDRLRLRSVTQHRTVVICGWCQRAVNVASPGTIVTQPMVGIRNGWIGSVTHLSQYELGQPRGGFDVCRRIRSSIFRVRP